MRRRNNSRSSSTRSDHFTYSSLEDRKMLAVISYAGGQLLLQFDSPGESLVLATDGDNNVTINGSDQISGNQVPSNTVTSIQVSNTSGGTAESIEFNGSFANGILDSISVNNINSVAFNGTYDLMGSLDVSLNGTGGGISDGPSAAVSVGGLTTLTGNQNFVGLNSGNHIFVGGVRVDTDPGFGAAFRTADDIEFGRADIGGNLFVKSSVPGKGVTSAPGAVIKVDRDLVLDAGDVTLGDTIQRAEFGRITGMTTGKLTIIESGVSFLAGNSIFDSIDLTADEIFDGFTTNITITNEARFTATSGNIRLGDNGTDTLNIGQVQFQSPNHVSLFTNSDLTVFGDNDAQTLRLIVAGALTDASGSTIDVVSTTSLQSISTTIGDDIDDLAPSTFNTGSLSFWSINNTSIEEDSDMFLIDSKNQAQDLFLKADGFIGDNNDAFLTALGVATFEADGVLIGDTETDRFNAGSIMFNVAQNFVATEDSSTDFSGASSGAAMRMTSAGDITNSPDAQMSITNRVHLIGNSVDLNRTNSMAGLVAGSTTFDTSQNETTEGGNVQIVETSDDGVFFVGTTTVTGTLFTQASNIADFPGDSATAAPAASIQVSKVANFNSDNNVVIGDGPSIFNANAVILNAGMNVELWEDSSMLLADAMSSANNMTLRSVDGSITDSADAMINVADLLDITAEVIQLGDTLTDQLTFTDLRFTATGDDLANVLGNMQLFANSAINLTGINFAADNLELRSDSGGITDNDNAQLRVGVDAVFAATNGTDSFLIELGELGTDCVDITGDFSFSGTPSSSVNEGGC